MAELAILVSRPAVFTAGGAFELYGCCGTMIVDQSVTDYVLPVSLQRHCEQWCEL